MNDPASAIQSRKSKFATKRKFQILENLFCGCFEREIYPKFIFLIIFLCLFFNLPMSGLSGLDCRVLENRISESDRKGRCESIFASLCVLLDFQEEREDAGSGLQAWPSRLKGWCDIQQC